VCVLVCVCNCSFTEPKRVQSECNIHLDYCRQDVSIIAVDNALHIIPPQTRSRWKQATEHVV